MSPDPLSTLAVDITAARMGGGASRARELSASLAALAPDRPYAFALSRPIAERLTSLPPRTSLVLVPRWLQRPPLRLAWEHLVLPSLFDLGAADWILSPFNVLPLGPSGRRGPRRAVIVSNIGPFAPEILGTSGGYQRARNAALRGLTIRSLERADVVFLLSREARTLLAPWLSGKRVLFLPMAPPGPSVLEEAESARLPSGLADAPFFVLAGDLHPYKGVEDAVAAVQGLVARGRDARLVVAGTALDAGYARRLSSMAVNGTRSRVRFVGPLPHPTVLALMRGALATVVCSRVENTSRVPVEAMAMSSPVVIADRPYARDSCGDAALYYRAGDSGALAAHMDALLDQPAIGRDLVELGRRRLEDIDWLSATRAILDALGLL